MSARNPTNPQRVCVHSRTSGVAHMRTPSGRLSICPSPGKREQASAHALSVAHARSHAHRAVCVRAVCAMSSSPSLLLLPSPLPPPTTTTAADECAEHFSSALLLVSQIVSRNSPLQTVASCVCARTRVVCEPGPRTERRCVCACGVFLVWCVLFDVRIIIIIPIILKAVAPRRERAHRTYRIA